VHLEKIGAKHQRRFKAERELGAVAEADGNGVLVGRAVETDSLYGPAFHLREFHNPVVRQPGQFLKVKRPARLRALRQFGHYLNLWDSLASAGLLGFGGFLHAQPPRKTGEDLPQSHKGHEGTQRFCGVGFGQLPIANGFLLVVLLLGCPQQVAPKRRDV
jgi:hypothetical protein